MAVARRTGYLAVKAPSDEYLLRTIGNREFSTGQAGGRCLYCHAFLLCDPKPGTPGLELNVTLRRGSTVSDRVVGTDDQPVTDVSVLGRMAVMPSTFAWNVWRGGYHRNTFNGRFELHGLDPDTEIPVFFLEPRGKLGATVHLSGKSAAGGPVTVRLQQCRAARARLIDAGGRPVTAYGNQLLISMAITPDAKMAGLEQVRGNPVLREGDFVARIDPINYRKPAVSDSQGRISFPALIPGAIYRVMDDTVRGTDGEPFAKRKEFTVKPGETLELGDILIGKPSP